MKHLSSLLKAGLLFAIMVLPVKAGTMEEEMLNPVVKVETLEGSGSGVVIKQVGGTYYLLTNEHVVTDNQKVILVFKFSPTLKLEIEGDVIKVDPKADLALISVTPLTTLPLTPRSFCTEAPKAFDEVFAVGAGLGFDVYPTKGIISNTRFVVIQPGMAKIMIQHSAEIVPGNSGGPLYKLEGEHYCVQGINAMGYRGAPVVGLAIPLDTIYKFLGDFK